MKITQIRVQAGRTLSFKNDYYSNCKPTIELTAELEEGEDGLEAAKALHQKAENLLEDQCDELAAFVAARKQSRERAVKREQSNCEKKPELVTA
jgi:cytochrome c553